VAEKPNGDLQSEIEKSRVEIVKLQERVRSLTLRRAQREEMAKQVQGRTMPMQPLVGPPTAPMKEGKLVDLDMRITAIQDVKAAGEATPELLQELRILLDKRAATIRKRTHKRLDA